MYTAEVDLFPVLLAVAQEVESRTQLDVVAQRQANRLGRGAETSEGDRAKDLATWVTGVLDATTDKEWGNALWSLPLARELQARQPGDQADALVGRIVKALPLGIGGYLQDNGVNATSLRTLAYGFGPRRIHAITGEVTEGEMIPLSDAVLPALRDHDHALGTDTLVALDRARIAASRTPGSSVWRHFSRLRTAGPAAAVSTTAVHRGRG